MAQVTEAGADALAPAPTALRERVPLQANGAPLLSALPPGATFAALREHGDARAGFGGMKGPMVDGPIVGSMGPKSGGAALDTALKTFASQRLLVQVRGGKIVRFPPESTTGHPWMDDFVTAIGGEITTSELAAIALWLQGWDLTGATFDVDADGFSFLVTSTGNGCDAVEPGGTAKRETLRQVLHLSRKGVLESRAATVLSSTVVTCERQMPLGRRPEGVAIEGDARTVGGWFARAAKLEAISIPAFERLARELAHHGADPELVRAAHRARRDEVRHAATMRTLAREAGESEAALVAPDVGELPIRSVFAIALENAVEGCLLETFAALVATHQARHATSYRVRRKMDAIATDETRHAELAWAVDAWCRARLTSEENAALDRARHTALTELKRTIANATPAPSCLGEPDPIVSSRLVDSMLSALS